MPGGGIMPGGGKPIGGRIPGGMPGGIPIGGMPGGIFGMPGGWAMKGTRAARTTGQLETVNRKDNVAAEGDSDVAPKGGLGDD
mgnify:FL=1